MTDHPSTDQGRPRLLDLFCGAGGAASGYASAGFEVVGVDVQAQPNYPFRFIQADAIDVLKRMTTPRPPPEIEPEVYSEAMALPMGLPDLPYFDAIHASPPCQAYTSMNRKHEQAEQRAAHPALIAATRELLEETGLPYVIENVGGAVRELRNPIRLCGRALGVGVHRHRLFETNFPLMGVSCTGGRDPFGVYGKLDGRLLWARADGTELRAAKSLEDAQAAMGMDWSDWDGLREAVPPAMTEHIGGFLLAHLNAQKAAA